MDDGRWAIDETRETPRPRGRAIRASDERGLAGARTSAIARGARVNQALLYYYFQSKDALWRAALRHCSAWFRSSIRLRRASPERFGSLMAV